MKLQTFWSRYKVMITGALMAIATALSPLILKSSQEWDYRALIVAAGIGLATWIGREARGKNWTMGGQVSAALVAFSSAVEGHFDIPRMIMAVIIAFASIPIPPIKLSTYESSAPIVEAKIEAKEIKEERDAAAAEKGKADVINLK